MKKKTITAIIERGDDGAFSIYAQDDNVPVFANGLTEKEARDEFEQIMKEQAEYIKETTGEEPQWYSPDIKVNYRYDLTAFFQAFPFVSASGLARAIGINPSLMRKYKSGIAKASEAQKNIIQSKLDNIVERLQAVHF